jgi:hypothetical protein
MRLARAGCGGVDYWLGLPIPELLKFLGELADQLQEEQDAAERASKRR